VTGGARTAGLPAETGILPDHTPKNNEGGLAIGGSGPDAPLGRPLTITIGRA